MKGSRRRIVRGLAALAVLAGCSGGAETGVPSFDGRRAFRDLVDLVEIGPRPSGSAGAVRARELIRQRLRQAGWRVREHSFRAGPPGGPEREMVNLIGHREGARAGERILLVTHYDTKAIEGIDFLGANDGASGVALLLELARQLGARDLPFTLELVFFDGEEAIGSDITPDDGLYGSRALAARMEADGTLRGLRALVLVDMVADRDLDLSVDLSSDPALRRVVNHAAAALGMESLIHREATLRLVDDHTPFQRKGIREVIAFIDFQFGGRRAPGRYWHTARDDLEAVSEESLNSVGCLVVETLWRIQARLLERAPEP